MSAEQTPSPAPLHQVVGRVLGMCQGCEYYYDAYYGPGAPFADARPAPDKVAELLQDLCRAVPAVIGALKREREELLAIADRNREQLAARVRYIERELAMPVGPDRLIDIDGNILTIAEFMAHLSKEEPNPEVSGPPSGGSTAPRCWTAAGQLSFPEYLKGG